MLCCAWPVSLLLFGQLTLLSSLKSIKCYIKDNFIYHLTHAEKKAQYKRNITNYAPHLISEQ